MHLNDLGPGFHLLPARDISGGVRRRGQARRPGNRALAAAGDPMAMQAAVILRAVLADMREADRLDWWGPEPRSPIAGALATVEG
jgi:hypothetical protein